jgi:hypothetical protein
MGDTGEGEHRVTRGQRRLWREDFEAGTGTKMPHL